MRFRKTAPSSKSGFTLAEILAALAFMAVVIPVAVAGVQVAGLSGQSGLRREAAARIAERILNEQWVTGRIEQTASGGILLEGGARHQWSLQSRAWSEDEMNILTVRVGYTVQGRDYEVRMSTLYDPEETGTQTTF